MNLNRIRYSIWGRLFALCCLIGLALPASSQNGACRLTGHVPPIVSRSVRAAHVASTEAITLALVLPLRNETGLEDLLTGLYDPDDARYGAYLTSAQFAERFAPTQADYDAVASFARAQGLTITARHSNRLVLDVVGHADKVEAAFGVRLNRYTDTASGRVFRAPDADPLLPASIANRLQAIVGLDNAAVWHSHCYRRPVSALDMLSPRLGTGPGQGLTPTDIREAYNIPSSLNGAGQTLAVFELDGYTPSDISTYEQYFGLTAVPLQNVLVDNVTGRPGDGADEVTLDLEMQIALVPGAKQILIYEGPDSNSGVLDTYNRIASDNLAKCISTSWGEAEVDNPTSFLNSEHTIFMEMASQGQAVFAAGGDDGAYDTGSRRTLAVDDPGAQPYVTSVGGTTLSTVLPGGAWSGETTWNSGSLRGGAGGGGISSIWPIPSYQSQSGVITSASLGSTTMRNVPDVSLNADPNNGYSIYYQGSWNVYGGTSSVAPLWAGFIALVNQERVGTGKAILGFANPALYQVGLSASYTSDFHDIADGSTNFYYPAVTGYDLATGWGSYNGLNLLADLAGVSTTALSPPNADFNQDGNEDLVFQNSATGGVAYWDMNGISVISGQVVNSVPSAGYQVVGVGDFNGDGLPDLVFQNQSTGQIAFWFLNHNQVIGGGAIARIPSPGYKVVGIGDFNGDGLPDLLFQNQTTGQLAVWYMSGTSYLGGGGISDVPAAGYQVVGVGDFNGASNPDILFQNSTTGQLAVWYMSGLTHLGGAAISQVPQAGWQARAVGDFNHDSQPDIAFQNSSSGAVVIWFINGVTVVGGGSTGVAPSPGYLIAGPR